MSNFFKLSCSSIVLRVGALHTLNTGTPEWNSKSCNLNSSQTPKTIHQHRFHEWIESDYDAFPTPTKHRVAISVSWFLCSTAERRRRLSRIMSRISVESLAKPFSERKDSKPWRVGMHQVCITCNLRYYNCRRIWVQSTQTSTHQLMAWPGLYLHKLLRKFWSSSK